MIEIETMADLAALGVIEAGSNGGSKAIADMLTRCPRHLYPGLIDAFEGFARVAPDAPLFAALAAGLSEIYRKLPTKPDTGE